MSLLDVRPVVLLTGISAAGKSTVADLLARRFDRGVHTATPSEEAWRQLRLRYRLGAANADAYHGEGFAVVLQDVIIGPVLEDYVASIQARPLVVVVLAPAADVVASREAMRAKTAETVDAIIDEALALGLVT